MSRSYKILGADKGHIRLSVEPVSDKYINISLNTTSLTQSERDEEFIKIPIKRFRSMLQELTTELMLMEKGNL